MGVTRPSCQAAPRPATRSAVGEGPTSCRDLGRWRYRTRIEAREGALADERAARRQASLRTVDLWSTHPAEGARADLLESLPWQDAQVPASPATFARIDAELRLFYAETHKLVLGTREFLG